MSHTLKKKMTGKKRMPDNYMLFPSQHKISLNTDLIRVQNVMHWYICNIHNIYTLCTDTYVIHIHICKQHSCWKPNQLLGPRGCRQKSHLSNDTLHTTYWEALIVGFDDPLEEMVAKHFEDHADIWDTVKDRLWMHCLEWGSYWKQHHCVTCKALITL